MLFRSAIVKLVVSLCDVAAAAAAAASLFDIVPPARVELVLAFELVALSLYSYQYYSIAAVEAAVAVEAVAAEAADDNDDFSYVERFLDFEKVAINAWDVDEALKTENQVLSDDVAAASVVVGAAESDGSIESVAVNTAVFVVACIATLFVWRPLVPAPHVQRSE